MSMNTFQPFKKNTSGCFSELTKELFENVGRIYFDVEDNALSNQKTIQKNSYEFLEKFFKKPFYDAQPLKMLITKIDIIEIQNGLIDLSEPSLHEKEYSSDEATRIHMWNEKALISLKAPFTQALLSEGLEKKIKNVLQVIKGKESSIVDEIITDFLDHHKTQVAEVLQFCGMLNLICISQSLYAFCYQLSKNPNFGRILELIICHVDANNQSYAEAFKLSDRLYSVYIGNMSARVFSEENLSLIEQALSLEGA